MSILAILIIIVIALALCFIIFWYSSAANLMGMIFLLGIAAFFIGVAIWWIKNSI